MWVRPMFLRWVAGGAIWCVIPSRDGSDGAGSTPWTARRPPRWSWPPATRPIWRHWSRIGHRVTAPRACGRWACRCSNSRRLRRSSILPSAYLSISVPASRAVSIPPSPRSCLASTPCCRTSMLIPLVFSHASAGSGSGQRAPMPRRIMRHEQTGLVLGSATGQSCDVRPIITYFTRP